MQADKKTSKIMVLGIDGFDPALAQKFSKEGIMPSLDKFIQRSSRNSDWGMLGNNPTITPPMWTTMATGATPMVHGITDFWNQSHEHLDELVYNLDSRMCKAEPLWNVTAEEGLKTLVWHWPGSSWPPTSDNENLHVVEGTQPTSLNMGVALVDWEKILLASESIETLSYRTNGTGGETGAGCIIKDPGIDEGQGANCYTNATGGHGVVNIILNPEDGELATEFSAFDLVNSPIRPAHGWAYAPQDAKEFTIIVSGGYVRRPALILKNNEGIYDKIAVYKSKKDEMPLFEIENGGFRANVMDYCVEENKNILTNRNYSLLYVKPDGSELKMVISCAMDVSVDKLWSPKQIYHDVIENVGYVPAGAYSGSLMPDVIDGAVLPTWDYYTQWQGRALNYMMNNGGYQVVFSHVHNVDMCGHLFWSLSKNRERSVADESIYQDYIREVYKSTDAYIEQFLHYLDEDWTIIILSDHGLLIGQEGEHPPVLGDPVGVNARIMYELGYTALKKDEKGEVLKEIDWEHTKAIAARGNHIWLNLKGRNEHGIVEEKDKYEVEREIISALYNYRDENNKRIVSIAIRNKEARLFGMGGEECGDIMYWLDEGFNRCHGDSLSTYKGYFTTSVSPFFAIAGCGVKENCILERLVRQVDIAPTMAALLGVRMPKQCEGAIVFQLIDEK